VPEVPQRPRDLVQITRGERLFEQNCAQCHGGDAQGQSNWRERGPDGRFPAPPLNGTGHAWHHPFDMLRYVILNGSPGGQGNMPAWKGKLTEEQIDDIIAWFQSKWPDEVYEAWYRIDRRSQK
jgi:mono/diheme cytochrome c family protein